MLSQKKSKGLLIIINFLLILIFILILFSCKYSSNFSSKGKITILKDQFYLKAGKGIYDIEIFFESKVSFNLIYLYKEIKYAEKYENIKSLKLYDIDFDKYNILCKIIDFNGISSINYRINFIKKQYWYKNRYESEPNNTYETSTDFVISNYKSCSIVGRLINEKDIDYYKIINDTYFDINCNLIISKANDNYSTFLYDENFNLISKINDNLPFKLISKKIYYIKVNSKNSDFSDLPYTIIVKPSTNINDLTEYEPNNDLENANRIELNKVLFGKILENDIDFYTFNIEKEGFYKIIFTSSNFPFSISFISDFGTFYSDYKMHRAGSFSHLLLPKGTYYIKVNNIEKSKNNSFSYSIKLEKDSPSIEIEPNDLESQANEWTIFDIISGSISWEYDVDYYYIQFEKKENNIIISTEDPFSILRCEIFVDNILTSSFDIKEGTTNILVNGEKVLIKLSSLNFTKEIVYTIKVGN